MSYTGSNISPSSNEFVPKTYTELEATATPKNIQVNLAIMRDTLEVPFSDFSKQDIWKYSSNSSRAYLPPAFMIRTSNPETQAEPSQAWQAKYDQLINGLPTEIKEALLENKTLSREEQYTSLLALDHYLVTVARAIVVIESGAEPLGRSSAAEARRQVNEQVPQYVHDNLKNSASEVLPALNEKLEILSRNHSDYDAIAYFSALSFEALNAISEDA